MGTTDMSAHALVADAEWLPLRLSEDLQSMRFVRIPRASHADLAYLEERFVPAGSQSADVAVARIADAIGDLGEPNPRFIFHSSMCGSTLLARLMDQPGTSMSLQEPIILNQLSARLSRGEDVAGVLDVVIRLLARPFGEGEITVVKPGNTANNLMPLAAERFPALRAVTMEASVEDLLRAVVKRGVVGRATYRRLYAYLARGGGLRTGFSAEDMWELTDLQVAALCWLIQHRDFARMIVDHSSAFRSLTLYELLDDRGSALAGLAKFFEAGWDPDSVAKDHRFDRHSKDRTKPYDDAQRKIDARAIDASSGPEIDWTGQWTRGLADYLSIPIDLPGRLIG